MPISIKITTFPFMGYRFFKINKFLFFTNNPVLIHSIYMDAKNRQNVANS